MSSLRRSAFLPVGIEKQSRDVRKTVAERRVGSRPSRQDRRELELQPMQHMLNQTTRDPRKNRCATSGLRHRTSFPKA
jgi:hypothetical protein